MSRDRWILEGNWVKLGRNIGNREGRGGKFIIDSTDIKG